MANFLEGFEGDKYESETTGKAKKDEGVEKQKMPAAGVKVTEHNVVIDKNYNRNKFIKLAVSAVLIIAIVLTGLLIVNQLNKVSVQNFEGKTIAEVRAWATKNSVEVDAQYEYNLSSSVDSVISQSVKSGESVKKGDTVQFIVSSGPNPEEKISVPQFENMSASQIQSWIDTNKLTNTKISEENSDTVTSGGFIKAVYRDITADKDNFKRKDYLTISVSKGPSTASGDTTMTNLVGKTKSEAESWASSYGVNLIITTKTSSTVAADKVISQETETGKTVKSGATVNITISGGTGVKVPSYSGVAMAEAQNANAGFQVTVKQRYSSSVAYGKLISQTPSAGTYVLESENKITVTYSVGLPYIGNLAGSSESEVAAYFSNFTQKGADISYSITYADSDIAKGTIISTSKYSEYLSMSETINIVVSNGSGSSQNAPKGSNNSTTSNEQETAMTTSPMPSGGENSTNIVRQ